MNLPKCFRVVLAAVDRIEIITVFSAPSVAGTKTIRPVSLSFQHPGKYIMIRGILGDQVWA